MLELQTKSARMGAHRQWGSEEPAGGDSRRIGNLAGSKNRSIPKFTNPHILDELIILAIALRDSDPARSHEAMNQYMDIMDTEHFENIRSWLRSKHSIGTPTSENILQDSLFEFVRGIQNGTITGITKSALALLKTICHRRAIDEIDRRKNRPRVQGRMTRILKAIVDTQSDGSATRYNKKQEISQIYKLLKTLSDKERKAVMQYADGCKFSQIARDLDMKEEAVKKICYRALEKLSRKAAASLPEKTPTPKKKKNGAKWDIFRKEILNLPKDLMRVATALWIEKKPFKVVAENMGTEITGIRLKHAHDRLVNKLGPGVVQLMGRNVPQ